jgi:hypothetical protein
VYQVDPLVCVRCEQGMSVLAFVTDPLAIKRILDRLGLPQLHNDKPPPPPEILRVAEYGDGWGAPTSWD